MNLKNIQSHFELRKYWCFFSFFLFFSKRIIRKRSFLSKWCFVPQDLKLIWWCFVLVFFFNYFFIEFINS